MDEIKFMLEQHAKGKFLYFDAQMSISICTTLQINVDLAFTTPSPHAIVFDADRGIKYLFKWMKFKLNQRATVRLQHYDENTHLLDYRRPINRRNLSSSNRGMHR
jgi:hypothetical protein